jgi:hypothetical protein
MGTRERRTRDHNVCQFCRTSLAGRRLHAKFCSRSCKTKKRDADPKKRLIRQAQARDRNKKRALKLRDAARQRYAADADYRLRKQRQSNMYYLANAEVIEVRRKENRTSLQSRQRVRAARRLITLRHLANKGNTL